MIAFLKKNDPILLFIAPVLMVFWVLMKTLAIVQNLNAFGAGDPFFSTWPFWLTSFGVLIGAVMFAFLLNRVVQNSILLGRISNFPMLFVAILLGVIPTEQLSLTFFVLSILQVPLLRWLLDLPEGQKLEEKTFNAGFVIGIMAIVNSWSLLLLWLPLQAMMSAGLLNFRRLAITFIGFITPVYLINAFLYLFNNSLRFPSWSLNWSLDLLPLSLESISIIGFALILIVFVFASLLQISTSSTLREKRKWYLVVTYLFISWLIITQTGFAQGLYSLFVPAVILFSRVSLNTDKTRFLHIGLLVLLSLLVMFNL
ncbi:MAG: hypothetical protein WEC59_09980 [Salibacteraceae bacterium]